MPTTRFGRRWSIPTLSAWEGRNEREYLNGMVFAETVGFLIGAIGNADTGGHTYVYSWMFEGFQQELYDRSYQTLVFTLAHERHHQVYPLCPAAFPMSGCEEQADDWGVKAVDAFDLEFNKKGNPCRFGCLE